MPPPADVSRSVKPPLMRSAIKQEARMTELDRLQPGTMGHHWWTYPAEGALLILLGIAAILVPIFASIAFAFLLGVILLIAGAAGGVHALSKPRAPGFGWA